MNFAAFDWSLLRYPLLAGLVVLVTHVIFGREVLARGIIFIDLTIAQVAAFGAVIAETISVDLAPWKIQCAGGVAALIAAGALIFSERRWPHLQEALIGCLYVLTASASILVLANNPHGAEHFSSLLAGQILWVTPAQLVPISIVSGVALLVWIVVRSISRALFYPVFAITVTASVQLVGVYLVFASLILPALAAQGVRGKRGYVIAYGVGLTGYLSGLLGSVSFDLPTGPLIVCALGAATLVAAALKALIHSESQ